MSACGRVWESTHVYLVTFLLSVFLGRWARKDATWGEKLRQFLCESMALSQARKIY